ncbi:hypothetical protein Hypma_002032 [Hypsizygus marmoreus]|uniref:Uncharacterized protein n=1 Tax=Hypsizygus marmoreus TaxID=39966 RepID=A0A369J4T4_HYPMA|nr:hypothetical protein Hypma_002032 [Hypsizygus marmoreus]
MPPICKANRSLYDPASYESDIEQGIQTVIEKVVDVVRIHPNPNHPKIIWFVPNTHQTLSSGDTIYVKGFGGVCTSGIGMGKRRERYSIARSLHSISSWMKPMVYSPIALFSFTQAFDFSHFRPTPYLATSYDYPS